MINNSTDIKENYLYRLDNELLAILLQDHSSNKNIIWATDNYSSRGYGYSFHDQIMISAITGYNGNVIRPRIEKSQKEQAQRIRQKAEVFTPSWICNKQNNLVDNAWFDSNDIFNIEQDKEWTATTEKIKFPTQQDFTNASDIDWSKSVSEIDAQLYEKYDLTPEEIAFIESTIKPME